MWVRVCVHMCVHIACVCVRVGVCPCVRVSLSALGWGRGGDGGKKERTEKKSRKAQGREGLRYSVT